MSTTDDQGGSAGRDEDFLAADYALGVLDAAGRRRAEARLADDPAFAREVAAFEATLMPLAGEVAAVPPPVTVPLAQRRPGCGRVLHSGAASASPPRRWRSPAWSRLP
jgi:anti-sigma-K factor RskA